MSVQGIIEDYRPFLYESAPVGICEVNAHGVFVNVNPYVCEMLGFSKAELVGMTFKEITHSQDIDADIAMVNELLSGENDKYTMHKRYLTKTNKVVWVEIFVQAIRLKSDFDYFLVYINKLPNGGNYKVERSNKGITVRPTMTLLQIVKDNPKEALIFFALLAGLAQGHSIAEMVTFIWKMF